jgi:hypothetical protein
LARPSQQRRTRLKITRLPEIGLNEAAWSCLGLPSCRLRRSTAKAALDAKPSDAYISVNQAGETGLLRATGDLPDGGGRTSFAVAGIQNQGRLAKPDRVLLFNSSPKVDEKCGRGF